MPRASRSGRRYQARLKFATGMGELWEWVTGLPEGSRVQEIFFHLQLGIKVARSLNCAGAVIIAAGLAATADSIRSRYPAGRRMPRTTDDGGAYLARLNFTDGMGELWSWISALPPGERVQEIFFHLQLGIKVARSLKHVGDAVLAGGQPSAPAPVAAPAAVVDVPEAAPAPASNPLVLGDDWDLGGLIGADPA